MAENMCTGFKTVWDDFSDQLDGGKYKFNDDEYSTNLFTNKSDNDIDKVNAVSFWLFEQNLWDDSSFTINEKSNTDIVHYIVIWLIHMLRLKGDDKVMEFYNKCINDGDNYIKSIKYTNTNAYKSYMGLINSKLCLMNTGIKDISTFYDAFKSLCNMYNEFDGDDPSCTQCLDDANKFAEKYEILFNNNNGTDTEGNLYSQILSILSTDYYNFINLCYEKKEGCGRFPCLPPYSRCSLTKNALISIAFIFVAIPIFLGFAYKHSLFGFGKRSQKHYLREKRKKTKRKMYNYILFEESDHSRNSNNY
ncbi:Plasmodium variant antigen protein Cir/Yir/Bir, putative [Plasmodium chabaudi adami]|uniref:Plasmodium variant antigen protein Cir/Yir/Bir, putative n=1 Tax=Plasmodium chabaudi adami TaxID=5826 RepID=A0A1C6WFM2_PLACE|nr:Plasmodium variant antigen protein Cir/Yir/Bir, putative [Plasmodium chabaudi adami]